MDIVVPFDQISIADLGQVGGKNASLGEMIQHLATSAIKVPPGFATTSVAYQEFLTINQLDKKIAAQLSGLQVDDVTALQQAGDAVRQLILQASLPKSLITEVRTRYQAMSNGTDAVVAVRSSATSEDLPDASFAGQQETFLNVQGGEQVLACIKKVYASLFTNRAIAYRTHHKFDHQQIAMSVGIQMMVPCEQSVSGVMFTLDTETGFDQVVFITAAYGLGEGVVSGQVNPDEFYVFKPSLEKNKRAIVKRNLGDKKIKLIHAGNGETKAIDVPLKDQQIFTLTDDDIHYLAKQAVIIEKHYGRPMDIEWAKDANSGQLFILQARPETVKSQQGAVLETFRLTETGELLTQGRSVGQKIGQGKARVILDPKDMKQMQAGEVLVTDMTDPDWEPVMKKAAAIVTNRGGRTCHAAIIARELGVPAVVGCADATEKISSTAEITVSCAEGEIGHVYAGKLAFNCKQVPISDLPKIPVSLTMNLGNPNKAFDYRFIPNDGVGLARLEFIINDIIGIHPNAILAIDKLSAELKNAIIEKTASYASPKEFYIAKIVEGVATIGAAFYPKQVIVRFSDFKSNEYANLLGGKDFEPDEENPMLGYRGAKRYVSEQFRQCFALECEAIKRVRDDMGLENVQVMVPFVRTVTGAKLVIDLLAQNGLTRGKNNLKCFMMCEIPSNAIQAEDFLQYFDGFSIGSNDLTQLTLGVDRDSDLVADQFDERDAAVKALLAHAIQACKKHNKYVGICGQGPSDHPDLADWLMAQGITSMSLSPDSLIATWLHLAGVRSGH